MDETTGNDETTIETAQASRRDVLKWATAGAGALWIAPAITHVAAAHAAASGPPPSPDCTCNSLCGLNLIVNGGAEVGAAAASDGAVAPPPNWTTTSNLTQVLWGASGGLPTNADPGPPTRGAALFAGGPNNPFSSGAQVIDVSLEADAIDAGCLTFALSGWLGGYLGQSDYATLNAAFLDAGNVSLDNFTIGPVTEPERGGVTGLLLRTIGGTVPAGTRSVRVTLDMQRVQGSYNDGYADELSLVLSL